MVDVFISYSRSDKEHALAIASLIEQSGKTVWWDDQIPAGKNFGDHIDGVLKSANSIVVIWSKESVNSRWVREEAEEGAARGILVPVLIHDVEIPRGFRNLQTIDLIDWDGETETDATAQLSNLLNSRKKNSSLRSKEYRHSARSAADLVYRKNAIRNTGLMVFACAMFFLYAGWDFFEQDGGAHINRVRLSVIGGISFMAVATWFLRGPRLTSWVMCVAVSLIAVAGIVMNSQYQHPDMGLASHTGPLNMAVILVWGLAFGVISALPAAIAVGATVGLYTIALLTATNASQVFILSSAINLAVLGAALVSAKLWR